MLFYCRVQHTNLHQSHTDVVSGRYCLTVSDYKRLQRGKMDKKYSRRTGVVPSLAFMSLLLIQNSPYLTSMAHSCVSPEVMLSYSHFERSNLKSKKVTKSESCENMSPFASQSLRKSNSTSTVSSSSSATLNACHSIALKISSD